MYGHNLQRKKAIRSKPIDVRGNSVLGPSSVGPSSVGPSSMPSQTIDFRKRGTPTPLRDFFSSGKSGSRCSPLLVASGSSKHKEMALDGFTLSSTSSNHSHDFDDGQHTKSHKRHGSRNQSRVKQMLDLNDLADMRDKKTPASVAIAVAEKITE
jgi:hypothetical protein